MDIFRVFQGLDLTQRTSPCAEKSALVDFRRTAVKVAGTTMAATLFFLGGCAQHEIINTSLIKPPEIIEQEKDIEAAKKAGKEAPKIEEHALTQEELKAKNNKNPYASLPRFLRDDAGNYILDAQGSKVIEGFYYPPNKSGEVYVYFFTAPLSEKEMVAPDANRETMDFTVRLEHAHYVSRKLREQLKDMYKEALPAGAREKIMAPFWTEMQMLDMATQAMPVKQSEDPMKGLLRLQLPQRMNVLDKPSTNLDIQ